MTGAGTDFYKTPGFFLRPLSVERPGEIVRVYSRYASGLQYFTLSYPDFADVRGLTDVFAGVVAEQPVPFSIGLPGSNERVWGELVSGGYFETMRIPLAEGREFDERDAGASPPVVVVNDVLARQSWPGTSAIGRRMATPEARAFR